MFERALLLYPLEINEARNKSSKSGVNVGTLRPKFQGPFNLGY